MLKIEKTVLPSPEPDFDVAMIPKHFGFMATKSGDIIGKRGKPLVGCVDRCGYKEVALSEKGKTKSYLVHRLILATFSPVSNMEDLDVNHINGNKLDNRLENLEWCTRAQNIRHSYKNKLQKNVSNVHGSYRVLTEEDMLIIKIMHQQNLTDLAISEHIGCSRGLVSRKIREMGLR